MKKEKNIVKLKNVHFVPIVLEQGLQPACVVACHTDCLEYGKTEEILARAEERLKVLKERYPNANIYNPQGISGVGTVYLLADKPSVYGLPENPKVPLSQIVWKDYAKPLGKLMFGGVTMAVVGSMVARQFAKGKSEHEGGQDHEQ